MRKKIERVNGNEGRRLMLYARTGVRSPYINSFIGPEECKFDYESIGLLRFNQIVIMQRL